MPKTGKVLPFASVFPVAQHIFGNYRYCVLYPSHVVVEFNFQQPQILKYLFKEKQTKKAFIQYFEFIQLTIFCDFKDKNPEKHLEVWIRQ